MAVRRRVGSLSGTANLEFLSQSPSQLLKQHFFLDALLWNTFSSWRGGLSSGLLPHQILETERCPQPSDLASPSVVVIQSCNTSILGLFHFSCPFRLVLVCLEDRLGESAFSSLF